MKKRIAGSSRAGTPRARGLTVYHELGPDLYSATSSTFIGKVYALFGLKNIADAADSAGRGYPKLSAEYVVSQSPDLIVLADITCCQQSPRTVAPPAGLVDRQGGAHRDDRADRRLDRLALGAARSSTSCRRSPKRSRVA